jgi:pimeloyl-ACP methyl ester carboxylesterase
MRAGFEVYRAFDQDVQDNHDALKRNGKLATRILAVFGSISSTGSRVEEMIREVAHNVTGLCVSNAPHWIAEENPEAFASGLLRFLTGAETK